MGGGTGSGIGSEIGTGINLKVMSVETICRECPVWKTRCRFTPKNTACVFHFLYGKFHQGPSIFRELEKYSTPQLLRCLAYWGCDKQDKYFGTALWGLTRQQLIEKTAELREVWYFTECPFTRRP
jgi:hypothetical protein